MKQYEQPYQHVLPRRTYTIIRVDGRAFHTLLRGAEKPFDLGVMACMDYTTQMLCEEVQGARFAYVQSDEVSILLTDFDTVQTQAWFGGDLSKMVSISASVATWAFNGFAPNADLTLSKYAEFDSRVFTIPDPVEVANYFLWRQRDATRNSILSAGQAYFSHAQLQNKSVGEVQEMLWAGHNVNWDAYPSEFKRGRVCVHNDFGWHIMAAPGFTAQPGSFLADAIPPLPSLHQ
jgi:tRNA(His) 5'-end guanylyltransferase